MATINIEALLAPQSDEEPCGPNLEQDQAFTELDVAARGKEARESGKKGVATPAEEPKWSDVADKAIALLGDTKHLAVAVHLTRAATHLDGIRGTADGLTLLFKLLENFWDDIYPRLDEEEGDAVERMNTLMSLDANSLLVKDVTSAPIVRVKALGEFSLRSIRVSTGEITPKEGEPAPDSTHVEAAFTGADLDDLQAEFDAVDASLSRIADLHALLSEKVESSIVPSFDNLKATLQSVGGILSEQLARRGVNVDPADADEDGTAMPAPAAVPGQIRSRQDAILALDRVSEFFRQNEPSSPVPLLLERAKRLIAKDFLEILQDLTPSGLNEARVIGGLEDD